jgi:hypothetical protein
VTTPGRVELERALELHPWVGMAYGRPFVLWALGHVALAEGDVDARRRAVDRVARRRPSSAATSTASPARWRSLRRSRWPGTRRVGGAAARCGSRTRDLTEERLGADRYATEHAQGERLPTEALVGDVAPDDDAAAPGGDPVDA